MNQISECNDGSQQGEQILRSVVKKLDQDFKINFTTVQVEVEGHESDEMYCCIQSKETSRIGHQH